MQKSRIIRDSISSSFMVAMKWLVIMIPIFMIVVLCVKSWPAISEYGVKELVLGDVWKPMSGKFGFSSFIVSSIWVSVLALVFSTPLCFLTAIFIDEYSHKNFRRFMQPMIDVLAGIPSVVYGVWGIIVLVPFIRDVLSPYFGVETSGYSLLAGGLVLAVMIIPFMLNMMLEMLATVPVELREAALSMGMTRWQMMKKVVIKRVMTGFVSAVGLGLARALGETMAVMMVVGNTVGFPDSVFSSAYPLPALIANNYGEMMSIPQYESALMFAALILFVVAIIFNFVMHLFIRHFENKYS